MREKISSRGGEPLKKFKRNTAVTMSGIVLAFSLASSENGTGAELETQLLIALKIGYLSEEEFKKLNTLLEEIMKMLNKLISTLTPKT